MDLHIDFLDGNIYGNTLLAIYKVLLSEVFVRCRVMKYISAEKTDDPAPSPTNARQVILTELSPLNI